jgi:hypothetical protein
MVIWDIVLRCMLLMNVSTQTTDKTIVTHGDQRLLPMVVSRDKEAKRLLFSSH